MIGEMAFDTLRLLLWQLTLKIFLINEYRNEHNISSAETIVNQ